MQQPDEEDHWIEGWGLDEGKLVDERSPTRWDLDGPQQTSRYFH